MNNHQCETRQFHVRLVCAGLAFPEYQTLHEHLKYKCATQQKPNSSRLTGPKKFSGELLRPMARSFEDWQNNATAIT